MIKAVIFDFDGTLADTFPILVGEGRKMAGEEGYEFPDDAEELRDASDERLREMFQIPTRKVPFLFRELRDRVGRRISEAHPFPGMKEVVEALSGKYAVGLLTTNSGKYVDEFLSSHGLKKYFEETVAGLSLHGKSGRIKKMAKKLGAEPSETVYVADGEKDVEACRHDEVSMIAVTWGYNTRRVLEEAGAEHVAEEPEEIMRILEGLG